MFSPSSPLFFSFIFLRTLPAFILINHWGNTPSVERLLLHRAELCIYKSRQKPQLKMTLPERKKNPKHPRSGPHPSTVRLMWACGDHPEMVRSGQRGQRRSNLQTRRTRLHKNEENSQWRCTVHTVTEVLSPSHPDTWDSFVMCSILTHQHSHYTPLPKFNQGVQSGRWLYQSPFPPPRIETSIVTSPLT